MKRFLAHGALTAIACAFAQPVSALPTLQLYLEGATYDSADESWVFSAGDLTRLWVIGDADSGAGIFDVRLSVAYAANPFISISLTPLTTGGYGGFTDPSTPVAPSLIQVNADGVTPTMGDGRSLPSHGQFGDGIWWHEFDLGDFTLTDSPVADFIDSFPAPHASKTGQINVYQVSISGAQPGETFHVDAYDHIVSQNRVRYVFAPFSHDAAAGGYGTVPNEEPLPVPAPATMGGVGLALVGVFAWIRRRPLKPATSPRRR